LRVGASADTNTTLSSARSKRCSVAPASVWSRSSSLRVSASTGTLSAARRAQIALPTKPPAPITTTRLGARRMEEECSSIVGLREQAALGIFNIEFLRQVELRGARDFESRFAKDRRDRLRSPSKRRSCDIAGSGCRDYPLRKTPS